MGVAIAASAWRRGAEVVLIAGPLSTDAPIGPRLRTVETTEEMLEAVRDEIGAADVLVMAAAPADFRASDGCALESEEGERAQRDSRSRRHRISCAKPFPRVRPG